MARYLASTEAGGAEAATAAGGLCEKDAAIMQIESSGDGEGRTGLSWRIGDLSLPEKVVTVNVRQTVGAAFGKMVAGEYSQLPVVDERGRLRGAITWETIACGRFAHEAKLVSDAMLTNPHSCRESDELFPRIDDIKRHGFSIIVDGENVVTGILTAADLSGELGNRVRPFTVLEEIERRLRRLVSLLSLEELRASFPDGDSRARRINSPEDLTLGNYSFLLDSEERWSKLGWPYERADMVDHLRRVAAYRNSIAHWDINAPGQGSDELSHAIQVLRMLKVIDHDPSE